ncbi:hypothetical protein F4810DRAFT_152510 [Camillea tinctor]|nr:hypothetical protein F4810DRAFT_152510 [Camillea tinctor]
MREVTRIYCKYSKAAGQTLIGIVTRFDIQTYSQIKTQYTVNVYDPSDYVNIMRAMTELQEAMEADSSPSDYSTRNGLRKGPKLSTSSST